MGLPKFVLKVFRVDTPLRCAVSHLDKTVEWRRLGENLCFRRIHRPYEHDLCRRAGHLGHKLLHDVANVVLCVHVMFGQGIHASFIVSYLQLALGNCVRAMLVQYTIRYNDLCFTLVCVYRNIS